jgi:hypothetical protein
MMDADVIRGELKLAPDIGFTRLPFGGGVLLNSRTLAIAECGERDAESLASLLAASDPDHAAADRTRDAGVGRMAAQLLEAGWLIAVPDRR